MDININNELINRVSIIIPCFNQGQYLSDAIDSALNQTYADVEIIVVNDASTDNTAEIMKTYSEKYKNILFINQEKNVGVVESRNIAVSKSSGVYILPLDADDIIDKTFVEKAVKILDSDSDIKIVYSRIQFFGSKKKEFKLEAFNPDRLIFNNCIPNTAMYRKSDFVAVGGYKDYMKEGWEDWNLWLSILETAKNKEKCAYKIDEVLFWYRQFESGSRSDFDLKKKNILFVNMIVNHKVLYSNCVNFYRHISKSLPSKLEKKNKLLKKLVLTILSLLLILISLIIIK